MFLSGRELSKPIKRDGREHIEYVATQIVTEYFRHAFRPEGARFCAACNWVTALINEGHQLFDVIKGVRADPIDDAVTVREPC